MNKKIIGLRKKISIIDKDIIRKLAARTHVARQLGLLKKRQHLPLEDKQRERELGMIHRQWAREAGFDQRAAKKIFTLIIKQAKKIQKSL